jgi:transcriptional regulator with AAA-type ATPase domain/pSer/pThr/pTyr-binding forkhead associated (FHA) protein
MAVLVFFKDDHLLFEYRITARRTTIGRSDTCDVALPGESVSRLHCWVEQHQQRFILMDKSRHGTIVANQRIERKEIEVGEAFVLGDYKVFLREEHKEVSSTIDVLPKRNHEFIYTSAQQTLINRASVIVTDGASKGKSFLLKRSTMTIGSLGSDLVLIDSLLQKDHCMIRVSRGRAMVEAGSGPVFLDGQRVTTTTPVYSDEEVFIGGTSFRIESRPVVEEPEAKTFGTMIGTSFAMQRVFGQLRLFAGHDFPVLIFGESGTGKELAAKGIHEVSTRSSGPFIAINCGAIPTNLIESELFGHEKGAFSGATTRRDGAFQQAHGGTLFLDELGDLPLEAQVKLLRVLESGEVRRVGGSKVEYPNVRIVTATNKHLSEMVHQGLFREDLLFRLQVLSIKLPSLRERIEDIPLLAKEVCLSLHKECRLSPEAEGVLCTHSWPGNVRELRNVLTRGFVLGGTRIDIPDIELYSSESNLKSFPSSNRDEAIYLRTLIQKHNGNRSAMARELGLPRTTLLYKLQRLGLVESK